MTEPKTRESEYRESLDSALADAKPDESAAVRAIPTIQAGQIACQRHDRLDAEAEANLAGMKEAAEKARQASRISHRLEIGTGRPTKPPAAKLLDEFLERVERADARSREALVDLPGVVKRLRSDYVKLTKRGSIVRRQREAVKLAMEAADSFLEKCKKAAALEDEYRKLIAGVKFFVVDTSEVVKTGDWCPPHNQEGVPFLIQFMHKAVDAEHDRLDLAALHRAGKKSEEEQAADEKTARAEYRLELEKAAKAFRATKQGQGAWDSYRQVMGIFDREVSSAAPLEKINETRRMVGHALKGWYGKVIEYAKMESKPKWFPEVN